MRSVYRQTDCKDVIQTSQHQIVVFNGDVDHIARLHIVDRIAIISVGQRSIVLPALITICILLRRTALAFINHRRRNHGKTSCAELRTGHANTTACAPKILTAAAEGVMD